MGTFTKKVIALTIAFAMAYTASVIGFTYGVADLSAQSTRASYHPPSDHILVDASYLDYASRKVLAETVLHELAHWTGRKEAGDRMNDDDYAEEVVAELTILMLCDVLNLKYADKTLEQSVFYLDYHPLAETAPEVDIEQAQDDATEAASRLIGLFNFYGMVEGEPFDVVKAVFPRLAVVNRGGKDAQ